VRDSQHVEATSLTYSATPPSTPKSPERLAAMAAEINTRPRKTLDWDTPADLFGSHLTLS